MNEARRTLDSLRDAGLIEWLIPLRDLDLEVAPARWNPTYAGRRELAEA